MLKRIGAEEGGEFKAVASGTLPCGRPVIIKADGTVAVVAQSTTSADTASTTFTTNQIKFFTSATYDSVNDRVVIAYTDDDNNDYGTVIAGTVSSSDNSISFGSPHIFYAGYARDIGITYDANAGKCVIGWYPFPNARGDAVVATVNPVNNSISTGSVTSFESSLSVASLSAVYAPDQQKVIFTYYANSVGRSIVGTVSGTSISFGSHVVYNNASTYNPTSGYDTTNNRLLVAFKDNANSNYGTAMIGTVSGTSITFGSEYVWTSNSSGPLPKGGILHDTVNNKNVVFYTRGGTAYARVITIDTSDNSISYGTEVQFRNYPTGSTGAAVFNEAVGKFEIMNKDENDNEKAKLITGTISGTDISFGTDTTIDTNSTDYFAGAYNSTLKNSLFAYSDETNDEGRAFVSQLAFTENNLTSENYIGMSRGVVSESALSIGATSVVNTGTNGGQTIAYDTNSDRVVIAYKDTSNGHGKAVVGTVSGGGVSFGTPVTFNAASTIGMQPSHGIAFDSSNNKVVIVYKDNGNSSYGTAIVGTVDPSDNSISYGSEAVFESAHTTFPTVTFDSSANKVLISYCDYGDSSKGKAIVGTVSGTSISFGSAAEFEGGDINHETLCSTFDSANNKVVIAYRDGGDSNKGKAVVATVSGTSVSFGTPVEFSATNFFNSSITFDSTNNKIIIVYGDSGNSNYGTAVVGTVSATAISFGSTVVWNSSESARNSASYSSTADKTIVFFRSGANSDTGRLLELTTSGTSVTASSTQQFSATTTSASSSVFDPDNNVVVNAYIDEGNTTDLETVQVTGTTIIRGQATNGQAASMDIIGSVSTNQIGLTAGQQYFVQTDGTIGTTAATPSVLAGTAISATELVVKT